MASISERWASQAEALQDEIKDLIRELCKIPAPSNHEERRAEFCRQWFVANGFENVTVDEALNVLAPVNIRQNDSFAVIMAHTDTVFPDMTPLPFSEKDGYMYSPGVGDDTAQLAVMMVCARLFKNNGGKGVLFVANSGEEGLGNLKGSRAIVETYAPRITEFISLDHSNFNSMVTQAVGSHRYKVELRTEGGHSFSKFGNRNAIRLLASMIDTLYSVKVPQQGDSITTYNVGTISGGTSINTIAQQAEMTYEYRSNNKACLEKMQRMFQSVIEAYRNMGLDVNVQVLGERPCSGDVDAKRQLALVQRIQAAAKACVGHEMEEGSGSTDCNMPLSRGIPAACFGASIAFGAHTREEKLDISSLLTGTQLLLNFLQDSY